MNVLVREMQLEVQTQTVGTQDWMEASKDLKITSHTQAYTSTSTLSPAPIPTESLDEALTKAGLWFPVPSSGRRTEAPDLIEEILAEHNEAWKTLAAL